MMFSKLAAVSSLIILAAASPTHSPPSSSQCDTGSLQCCNSVQSADSTDVAGLAGLLGIVLQGVTGQVGLTCDPITAIGVGSGSSCSQQPVCCTGNNFSGLLVLGCSPINLGL